MSAAKATAARRATLSRLTTGIRGTTIMTEAKRAGHVNDGQIEAADAIATGQHEAGQKEG